MEIVAKTTGNTSYDAMASQFVGRRDVMLMAGSRHLYEMKHPSYLPEPPLQKATYSEV